MRIAMPSWESLNSIAVGGVAPHVSELSESLAARGHELHVFTRIGAGQKAIEKVGSVWYHRCPFDAEPVFVKSMDNMCDSFLWHLRQIEDLQGRPFDVVHGHDWLCAKGVARAKNEGRNRAVLTMHSTEFGRCGNTFGGGESPRISHIEWEGMYCADRVIAVSNTLRREIIGLHQVPEEKIVTVYNGVHSSRFAEPPPSADEVRRRCEIGALDPVVLFVGRLAWQKGPDILLETVPGMLSHHRNSKFLFVGDGEMRQTLEHRAQRLGIDHAVRSVGKRTGRELVDLFHIADVLAVPSRNEPFGIVILEGWAAGKPVIATRNGGPAEFVRHEVNGRHVFDQADSVGWGVGTALAEIEDARRMGRNGRTEVQSRFAWDVIAEQTEQVYADLAA